MQKKERITMLVWQEILRQLHASSLFRLVAFPVEIPMK